MTRHAVIAAGRVHWSGALMFLMTRRAREILDDIRLMEIVTGMTILAGLIDVRHCFFAACYELGELQRRRVRGESNL